MSDHQITITIDTREQQPWAFRDAARVRIGTVPAGDYALAGDEANFAIERKSLSDFVTTIVCDRERFQAELDRMDEAGFPVKVIIVEADWMDVIEHRYAAPEIQPPLVLRRVAELVMDGVCVLFCSNPVAAAGLCWRVLYERAKRIEGQDEASL